MGIWMYLVLAAATLVAFNVVLATILTRANVGERSRSRDEWRLKSR
jgi:hypothetical protein